MSANAEAEAYCAQLEEQIKETEAEVGRVVAANEVLRDEIDGLRRECKRLEGDLAIEEAWRVKRHLGSLRK